MENIGIKNEGTYTPALLGVEHDKHDNHAYINGEKYHMNHKLNNQETQM